MFRRILGALGRVLISIGTLMLLFVVYEIWGTNLQEASAQRQLGKEFKVLLAHRPADGSIPTTTQPPTSTGSGATPPENAPANLLLPNVGQPIATIRIPKIGVTKTVVEGVTLAELKRGPGHYPETPLPGQMGNVGIAGHRTTYGAPFHNIDQLANGDEIVITTLQGTFHYRVDSVKVVAPSNVTVLDDNMGDSRLTLTACHPKYSASQRIIVTAILAGEPVARMKNQAPLERVRTRVANVGDQAERVRIDGGLDGIKSSKRPAILWGAAGALIWLAAWAISQLLRRRSERRLLAWTPYLVGAPIFLVVLYVFFENFARVLPSNF